jgi:predicted acyltransferase
MNQTTRFASLDQFRGYTVAGMFLVNFVGSFEAIKAWLPTLRHHHDHCSYADTIMPQFFFAVGFAYRLTFSRRQAELGWLRAAGRVVRRALGLILLGFVVHHLDGRMQTWAQLQELGWRGFLGTAFQRNFFQTLTHIGVTSLWVLPVIGAGPVWRILFMAACAVTHVAISHEGYYDWVMGRPGIDGGPLGFLTWTIPMLVGSLACDLVIHGNLTTAAPREGGSIPRLLLLGCLLMLAGYLLSCVNRVTPPNASMASIADCWNEPPFVHPTKPVNYWTMSQRAGSVPYLVFGAGFSVALFAMFVLICDRWDVRLGLFRTLGTNALAAYVIHDLVDGAISPWTPRDAPLWYVLALFAVFFAISSLFVRYLERNSIYLRL